MESVLARIARTNGERRGKIVGRYYIGEDSRIELNIEKFERDFRHTVEFVLKTSPYQLSDLMKLDFATFFRVANECEDREKESVDRLEKQTHGRY